MENRSGKSKKSSSGKKLGIGTALIAVVLVVCVSVGWIIIKQQITLSRCGDLADEKRQMISDAKLEQEKLKDELEKAGTDDYKEQKVREELGMVKPNERIYEDISQQ